MEGRYNTRSPAVKRLMREAQELSEPTDQYYAQPLEDNLFEWHFTVRGPADSDFQNGIYHGRIILPVDYPMKPPSIIWLTPNGRFETNKKICLSISGHHPESWQPSWSIRTALLAIIGFMPTRPGGAIGSLDYTPEERKVLAKKSQDWTCPACGSINQILLERSAEQPQASQEAKDLAAQIQFQGEKSKSKEGECETSAATSASVEASTSSPSSTVENTTVSDSQTAQQPPGIQQWTFPGLMPAMTPGFPPPFTWHSPPTGTPGRDSLAMYPRFPYPPSQQPMGTFPMPLYPPGFPPIPPPHTIGMFPFPPTFTGPCLPQALDNGNPGTASPKQPFQVSANNSSVISESNTAESSYRSKTSETAIKHKESSELSSAAHHSITGIDEESSSKSKSIDTAQKLNGAVSAAAAADNSSCVKGSDIPDEKLFDDRDEGTDQSQMDLPADKLSDDEKSQSAIPPLDLSEGEQRSSYRERSVSSSVPDLEKQFRPGQKGLRHRQSATATVPTSDAGEDIIEGAEPAIQPGQRIEAASGDTHPRLIRIHQPRAFAEARQAHRNVVAQTTQQRQTSQYDGSFFAMLILGIATALILLNRLVRMLDWSVLF